MGSAPYLRLKLEVGSLKDLVVVCLLSCTHYTYQQSHHLLNVALLCVLEVLNIV